MNSFYVNLAVKCINPISLHVHIFFILKKEFKYEMTKGTLLFNLCPTPIVLAMGGGWGLKNGRTWATAPYF